MESISEQDFDVFTFEASKPAVVFFSAKRCSVCKALLPVVEELAVEYEEKLNVVYVDVDENDSLVKRFRLRGIPTLIIFKEGEIKERISGFQPKSLLQERIEIILKG